MEYDTIPSTDVINKTADALRERGVEVFVVNDRAEALAKVKELIPKGASINNGSSTTLEEIGLIDYLKGDTHGYNNLHAAVLAEKDPAKQAQLRNESIFSEYYLGSVHAIAQTGEMIIASASGSQLPPIVSTSPNLIFVAGVQKIAPTYNDAYSRLNEHVVPLENNRMKDLGMGGTVLAKTFTFLREPAFMGRTVRMILVKEKLGF
ncbi:MAG: lactate utilization protein [Patescibacteria group bacterium]